MLFSMFTFLFNIFFATAQIELLNDEFDDAASLSSWQNITEVEGWNAEHLESHDINTTEADHLMMMPSTSSWYADWRGALLFKEVTGDFTFTTEVSVTNRAGDGVPSSNYSLAGLMIRQARDFNNGAAGWTPNGENYVFLSVGQAAQSHPTLPMPTPAPHFEVKNTVNGNSNLQVSGIPTAENVRIRLARVGDFVICLYQLPNEEWVVHRSYNRSDFPETVQIGFVTYTDWNKCFTYDPIFHNDNVLNESLNPDPSSQPNRAFEPDLIAHFDFARFRSVQTPADLVGDDLTQTPDSELLVFLGFPTEAYVPSVNVRMQAWLQGAYTQAAMMHTNLQNMLPMMQPYNRVPWNYNGSETINNIPSNMTDWVLIELRDAADNNIIVEQKAALLLENGQIVDAAYANDANINGVHFQNIMAGQAYYIIVRHRNHIGVASATPVTLPNFTPYDFSQANLVMGGENQLAATFDGHRALFCGDADSNGIISVSDFNIFLLENASVNVYSDADFDLNANITIGDFNFYLPNASKIGATLVRY